MAAPKKTASPKPQHRDIAFAQLHFTGTYNVRKMSSAPIEPLAATIARRGLLQNLIVVEDPKGRFDIAAGRRRFLAVGHSVESGAMLADVKLRCLVVDARDALELSLIENIEREAMNPAEEALAFAALVDDGMDIATVAASFTTSTAANAASTKAATNLSDTNAVTGCTAPTRDRTSPTGRCSNQARPVEGYPSGVGRLLWW